MLDETLNKAIKSASLLNNLDTRVGHSIVMSLFKQYREVVNNSSVNEFINFRIINFGLFYGKPKLKRKTNES